MKNIAKCKLCSSVIESFHSTDYVSCKCGEISVDGGEAMRCAAKDWSNFLRIDEQGKECKVSVKEGDDEPADKEEGAYIESVEDVLKNIEHMMGILDGLPQNAMTQPLTHYDMYSMLLLMSAVIKLQIKNQTSIKSLMGI